MAKKTSLTSRPLDLLYFIFFLIHLPPALLFDAQPVYPRGLVPTPIVQSLKEYIEYSGDFMIGGAMGYSGESSAFVWLNTFYWIELLFQVPVFIIGIRGLWKGSPSVYPILLAYGASTATILLPCVVTFLITPITSAETIAAGVQSVTADQRFILLSSYIPFFLLPLCMAIDMTGRISKLLRAGEAAMAGKKVQ